MIRYLVVPLSLLTLSLCAAQAQTCPESPDLHTTVHQAIEHCTEALHAHNSAPMRFGMMGGGGTINAPTPEQRANMYYSRSLLYLLSGQYDLAVADDTSAITLMSDYADAYAARGDAYAALGEHDKTKADYDFVAAHPSVNADVLNDRCWVRAIRGNALDLAVSDCTQALQIRPDNPEILDSRCFAYYRLDNYKAAIADCDAAIKINPRMASSLFVRGLAKLKSGDAAGGNADLAAAKDADYRVAEEYAVYGVKP